MPGLAENWSFPARNEFAKTARAGNGFSSDDVLGREGSAP